ncbi:MAG: restriction endonuclease subunit S [Cyclobacteriaceae bacterium]|nr:restriction endonuclease subunit S [Cyclobacteriaceae bacterium]
MKMDLKNIEWEEFYLNDIFSEIQRGKRLKKGDHKKGVMPYISSTALNNGTDGFIGNKDKVRIFSNCLTIANSGSVGATFFQPYSFVASDHVTKLQNKEHNKYVYLFISLITNRLKEKYSFNREINDKRIQKEKIVLPVNSQGKPDYDFMEAFMKDKEKEKTKAFQDYIKKRINKLKKYKKVIPIEEKEWGEFEIETIFEVKSGKRLTKADMKKGNKPFIGATDSNNGITEFVSNTNVSEDSNVLGVNYNGSVVENFYHPYKAIFSDDVKRLSFKKTEGNKHLFLFVKNQILKQKEKYQYGYKFNGVRMSRQKILLPINQSQEPDYNYMENYMKRLEYEKVKQYLDFKQETTA